jgi:FtsP/CotA-like multicopper oxidase with cupredoxin domain
MPRLPLSFPTRRLVSTGLAASLLGLGRGARAQPAPSVETAPDGFRVLRAAPARLRLRPEPAPPLDMWAFDGAVPGPTIRVRQGEEVRLRFVNDTPRPLTLHAHGVRNASPMDGVGGLSQEPVGPGASFDYRFTPPDAGTFLIRPLNPGSSGEASERGLTAVLVVEEREPPAVHAEHVLLVDDHRFGEDGAFAPFGIALEAATGGRLGNWLGINAKPAPFPLEAPPGARLRLRLVNACNARSVRIRFDDLKVYVAAVDGHPTDTFEPLRATLPFSPGSRYDLLLDMPETGKGAITALLGPGLPLVAVAPTGAPAETEKPPISPLPANGRLPPMIRLQNAVRRDVVIAGGARRGPEGQPVFSGDPARIWTVNGQAGRTGLAPLATVPRGSVVVLAIVNQTPAVQPLHLHGHVFRLLHPFDDGWEPYWLDTLQVPENRTVRIAFVADNPGRWALSSTVLERFDTGLWTWFEVT